jgi:exosome complex RNA-binding protein Rrp4
MENSEFINTKSLHSPSGGFADIILENGIATVKENSFLNGVFRLPVNGIRRLRNENGDINNSFKIYRSFDITIATNGEFTVSTTNTDEVFPYSTGALNNTQIKENFYLSATESGGSFEKGQIIPISSVNIDSATSATFSINGSLSSTLNAKLICEIEKKDGREVKKY